MAQQIQIITTHEDFSEWAKQIVREIADNAQAWDFILEGEAMKLLGISKSTLRGYCMSGSIKKFQIDRKIYYSRENINAFIKAYEVKIPFRVRK
ncbi:MAG: helix-turn-helix domain-containing protein [Prevotellaceae bacterium]|jgi:hypothetical protein|nr:helix-turn-helix domain-containing protein [Prevotellaceae bacterium]